MENCEGLGSNSKELEEGSQTELVKTRVPVSLMQQISLNDKSPTFDKTRFGPLSAKN